jgi:hypothetical protein
MERRNFLAAGVVAFLPLPAAATPAKPRPNGWTKVFDSHLTKFEQYPRTDTRLKGSLNSR